MSGETASLLGMIEAHPERALIIHHDQPFTPGSLSRAARDIRARHPQLQGANVALQCADSGDFLLRLIALDGFAREILLLPPCLSGSALKGTLSRAGSTHLLDHTGASAVAPPSPAAAADGETLWLFTTSGTTGEPKVFSHTLRSLTVSTRAGRGGARECRWGLAYQPHRFAGIQVVLQALASGNVLVLPPPGDINASMEAFARHRVNTLSATPSQWRNFLSHGALRGCALEQITLGGEIADQAILSALARQFPAARIVHIYASTEAGVGFSVADGRAGFPVAWLDQGPPLQLRISAGGSLLIRSPALSCSEALLPRLTADGYLDTQDQVIASGDRVYFLGRASGVINVGGNKVHPEEVESLVREVPGVRNALVSGRSSPLMGQLVLLEVQADDLSAAACAELKRRIRDHCRQHLPKYKMPALINIVQELAVSESGKVERKHCG